jgi:ferric-dicitrate binding protein FerR (iron transport regulator)
VRIGVKRDKVVIRLTDMDQNRQDIDENLLLQYLLGNTDEESRALVEAWLNADSGNRTHLDRLESLWLEAGKIEPPPVPVDVEAAWERMSQRIARHEETVKPGKESGRRILTVPLRYLLSAAAMVVFLVGLYAIFRLVTGTVRQVEVASGQEVVIESLPDGSTVTLNRNSKLTYPEGFKQGNRVVELTGEAFFEVRHDRLHPFTVLAGKAGIRVLGTSFGVKSDPVGVGDPVRVDDPVRVLEVSVSEGRVKLFRVDEKSGDTASLILMAGEAGILTAGALEPVRTDSLSPDRLFWLNRSLDFRRTPLSEVFSLLGSYFSVTITTSDPAVMDCRLTASFVNEPVESILEIIAESFGLKLEARGQNFHFTGHGCSKESD